MKAQQIKENLRIKWATYRYIARKQFILRTFLEIRINVKLQVRLKNVKKKNGRNMYTATMEYAK